MPGASKRTLKGAVIVDCVRTPIGRSHAEQGVYRDVRSDALAVACVRALLERTAVDPAQVEDLVLGCSNQAGEQGVNLARIVALVAGLPYETAGVTVNRLCGSGMQALHQAVHAIESDACDVQIVGGVEHMHHLPMGQGLDLSPQLFRCTSKAALQMGLTAELLARRERISRAEQDQFAWTSHQRAAEAQRSGAFERELVPVEGRDPSGRKTLVASDQSVRPDTSLEALAALPPAFLSSGGTVTAGNSSPRNDGAAAMLVMSRERCEALGLRPLARVVATSVCGVEPALMGLGPVAAVDKLLRRAGLSRDQIDLWEINEAFAVQALACVRQLQAPLERVNVHGGAVALGHPLGASGVRIVTTLVHAMRDRDARYGVAAMCIGLGQGIATLVEREK